MILAGFKSVPPKERFGGRAEVSVPLAQGPQKVRDLRGHGLKCLARQGRRSS